jgi:hypothetical protein
MASRLNSQSHVIATASVSKPESIHGSVADFLDRHGGQSRLATTI